MEWSNAGIKFPPCRTRDRYHFIGVKVSQWRIQMFRHWHIFWSETSGYMHYKLHITHRKATTSSGNHICNKSLSQDNGELANGLKKTIWNGTRPRALVQNQYTRELITARKTSHNQRMYLWQSLCTLYLHACQVRVTVGGLGLCCCVCVTSFKC